MKDIGMVRHIVPITAPAQKTATFIAPHVNMGKYESVQFLVMLGALETADFTMTVTCSAASAGSSSTAIAFNYRATAAAGTDTLGDVTAVESTGLAITNTAFDNMVLVIDVDAAELTADKPYVGLTFTDPGTADAYIGVVALLKPRYPQETNDGALT